MNSEEPMTPETNPRPSLELTESDLKMLESAAKWARLLAIVGFVGLGFMVLLAFTFGSLMSVLIPEDMDMALPVPVAFYAGLYLFFAIIYFFPVLYLYNFARSTQKAIAQMDQSKLSSALRSLNSHYRYIGVLMLIVLALYGLFFAIALMGVMFAGLAG